MAATPALWSCLRPSQEPPGTVTGVLPNTTSKFSVETFEGLAPFAFRLTPTVLLAKADGQTLQQVLPLLSVTGSWSPAQASVILNKVIQNGYQIHDVSSVLTLGTLALGLPVSVLDKLDTKDILLLAADQNFTKSMEQAPLPAKHKLVQRILQSTPGSTFLNIPDHLADQIPQSRLASLQISISEISQKKWTAAQAHVFFQAVLKSMQQYSSLSSAVLQGFHCGAANFLNSSQFARLVKAMKGKHMRLADSQLSCMTKRLTGEITSSDFEEYPAEVLFYMGPDKFSNTVNCQKYFHLVGQANVDLLSRVSTKRQLLLERAKACLETSTSMFSKENLLILGNLSCALNGSDIAKSDPYILTILQSCMSFTEDQLAAIEQQLENKYGSPSTWTVGTLTHMGGIAGALRSRTLQRISETEKTLFFPDFLSQLKTWNRHQFTYILEQLAKPQRQKRATTDCTRTPLTTEMVVKERDLLVSKYTSSSDLDACLPDDVLRTNLETFGKLEFQEPLLQVLKLKLDKIFGMLPEDYLPLLGNIARMYTATEIAYWNITTAETFSALVTGASWQKDLPKVKSLVIQHLKANGHQLDGTMLTVLAPYICALEDTQIKAIHSEAIRGTSEAINTSVCSQHQKNLFYSQLRAAYEENQGSPDAYYQLLKPAIGGAPSKDLIRFASGYPDMDVATFTTLNPDEVKKLSPQNLKDLLGANLPELNNLADDPVVKAWTQAHNQSDVNSLGLHLVAGLQDQPPNGFIDIPSAPHIPGRATTYAKDHKIQLFYGMLISLVLSDFL
ncbi:mesothelin-like [Carettochelys insculpta]|uniref:mesothelin-like n=1 Tax=Carettochelys insculpta TaxID=44489 RepID=UPI003EBF44DA